MTTGGEPGQKPARLVFLPGAGGRSDFWAPVSALLGGEQEHVLLGWPGFGGNPPDPAIEDLDGLLGVVLRQLEVCSCRRTKAQPV